MYLELVEEFSRKYPGKGRRVLNVIAQWPGRPGKQQLREFAMVITDVCDIDEFEPLAELYKIEHAVKQETVVA